MSNRILKRSILISFLAVMPFGQAESFPKNSKMIFKQAHKDHDLLIKRQQGVSADDIAGLHDLIGAQVIHTYDNLDGLELVRLPRDLPLTDAVKFYAGDPDIYYAEPNYFVKATAIPNDPMFVDTWGLNNTGAKGGITDVDLNAPEMWDISIGSKNTVVAVIDTGIEYTHPDLVNNMWINSLEIPKNGIDDDRNGYIDDIHGINAITNSGNPLDDNGHGTHCAGTIGAEGNNRIGVAGVMHQASIIACKFLGSSGGGAISDALECMDYLLALSKRVQDPVKVILSSNSWGGGGYSQAMYDALVKHNQAGILFIAAAGNSASDNDLGDYYPANYKVPNLISVAAIDRTGALANFSSYGLGTVHVAAPGVDILSTFLGGAYRSLNGTSMATPHVSGLLGLIKSWNPQLGHIQLKNLLMSSGIPATGKASKTISGRRIRGWDSNGRGATTCSDQFLRIRLKPSTNTVMLKVGDPLSLSVFQINCANPFGPSEVKVLNTGNVISLLDNGQNGDSSADDGIFSGNFIPTSRQIYDLRFPDNNIVYVGAYDIIDWRNYQASTLSQFEYRTIKGTALKMGDDTLVSISSPFPINFAGDRNGFTSLYVSSNGNISFTNNSLSNWENSNLPNPEVQTLVAPYWDDLIAAPAKGSDVFYEVSGTAPNRVLVVEWRNMPHFSGGGAVTFQTVFFENSSNIQFNYQDITFGDNNYNGGANATIGVQATDKSALEFSYNRNRISDRTSLLFSINNSGSK